MQKQRVPLPGEKPGGVWRPRKKRRPAWRSARSRSLFGRLLPWLVLLLILLGGLLIWRQTATAVTLIINQQTLELRTHRRTVEGAVRVAGVRPDETVYLRPDASTPLEDGMTITVAQRRPVIIHVDGETVVGASHELEPRAIAADLGITLGENDAVTVVRSTRPASSEIASSDGYDSIPDLPRELTVARAVRVIVNQDGERVAFETTAPTLGEALARAGYHIYEADHVSEPLDASITSLLEKSGGESVEISLERAIAVTVQDGMLTTVAHTHQQQVGELLGEMGLALSSGDYVLPGLDAPLNDGQTIRVMRVREEVLIEESALPYETVYVPDPDLELDQERVVQQGQDGVMVQQVRVRYENGVEVSRALEGEWVGKQAEPQVVAYGTQIVLRTLTAPDGSTYTYWRTLHVLATSYSPLTAGDKKPGDPRFGISGTGSEVVRGIIAVDPRVINLYTYMYVPEYGYGQALDVGGAVKGHRIDLGYSDEYLVQWNNWVDIYLLTPVPPADQIIWRLPD